MKTAKSTKLLRQPRSIKQLMASAARRQAARLRNAKPHRCVPTPTGSIRRVTNKDGEPLKRPVVLARFYECRVCGRDLKQKRAAK